ncbi:MAG TPA: multicopper oxidase domain-containing protein [Pseudogracilibacillus sp.]|nr:multicopper oxidase domain-containing protein [Pseudogracilibacillus sp.]
MKKNFGILIAGFIIILGVFILYFVQRQDMPGQLPDLSMKQPSDNTNNQMINAKETALPIPPLLKDHDPDPNKAEFHLNAQNATKEFVPGKKTETMGYNGDYLGPVIRVRKGEEVSVKVKNELDDVTTIHWHGLEVDGDQDGGPHSGIQPGESWSPEFKIEQPATTLWYHPHPEQETGKQVYKGLAGLFLIEDEVSDSLDIPKEYGVDDVPLVLQDKRFNSDEGIDYNLGMRDVMNGLQGDTMLVNGAVNPFLEVPRGMMRLRLLNGSNASVYELNFNNHQSFHQIASDGGFLEKPEKMDKIVLGPAERAEILVDFSDLKKGEAVQLNNKESEFMKFKANDDDPKNYTIPSDLTSIEKMGPDQAVKTRKFAFEGMGPRVNINGKQFDAGRIDEELKINDTEIWEITNESGMGMMGEMIHPFHAHGAQFQVLDRDGNPPPANETGWKDTVLVHPDEKVRVIATFKHPGDFMYHCHILEHEDAGMMGQFKID